MPQRWVRTKMSETFKRNRAESLLGIDAGAVAATFGSLSSSACIWIPGAVGVVSVNSQARRLGCLMHLLGLISKGLNVEPVLFALPSAEMADLHANLADQGVRTGFLGPGRSSVRHYIDAAKRLHLLTQQGTILRLTVRGHFLLEATQPDWRRPYPLAPEAKVFFLHSLLGCDYYGTAALLRLLVQEVLSVSEIKKHYHSELKEVLQAATQSASNTCFYSSRRDRLISVRNWKKSTSYSDHLVSAKVNWLADLGIVSLSTSGRTQVACAAEHEELVKDWAATAEPSEIHLLVLLLRYSQTVAQSAEPRATENLCSALETAFSRLSSKGPLAKIRLRDFILFLTCCCPRTLLQMIADGEPLFQKSTLDCGDGSYSLHEAARATQAYIVRENARDK